MLATNISRPLTSKSWSVLEPRRTWRTRVPDAPFQYPKKGGDLLDSWDVQTRRQDSPGAIGSVAAGWRGRLVGPPCPSTAGLLRWRILSARVDYCFLPCGDDVQEFLLFALGHLEMIKGAGKLRSDLVEIFGCQRIQRPAADMEPAVTSSVRAAKAANTSSFSRLGTLKRSRARASSAATSSNTSGVILNSQ